MPLSEAVPRIRIFIGAPGEPLLCIAERLATRPARAWSTVIIEPSLLSSSSTLVIEAGEFALLDVLVARHHYVAQYFRRAVELEVIVVQAGYELYRAGL